MITVGGCDDRCSFGDSPPKSRTSSSWTMLITSCVGVVLRSTASVSERSRTALMKSFATL